MRDAGNLLQIQFERFVDQQLVQPPVFAQDERIVEAGDQQDVLHPERHQVLEALEARFGIEKRLGHGPGGHGAIFLLGECELLNSSLAPGASSAV